MEWIWESLSRNPFSALSVIIAVTVLIVFQWWRQRKSLRYTVVSDESITDVRTEFNDRVKILFDDKPVKAVSLIVAEIVNDGWIPIEDKDFFEPVTISFGHRAEIMNCEVTECIPSNLNVELASETTQVTIKPLLLNRGDSIRIKALVENYQKPVIVAGRIKGVPQIKPIKTGSSRLESLSLTFSALIGFVLILIAWKVPEWAGVHSIRSKLYRIALNNLNPEEMLALDKELTIIENSIRVVSAVSILLFATWLGLYALSKYAKARENIKIGKIKRRSICD